MHQLQNIQNLRNMGLSGYIGSSEEFFCTQDILNIGPCEYYRTISFFNVRDLMKLAESTWKSVSVRAPSIISLWKM